MATDVCDQDDRHPAVACCFCRFPVQKLCAEHLSQHDVENYASFEHFHLPLFAAQWITTIDSRNDWCKWLYKLHTAYSLLRTQEQSIVRFEQCLDSLAGEELRPMEAELQEVKAKAQALRTAFSAEADTAIQATRTHCMDSTWVPDSALAALIWNYDLNHPETLEIVSVRVEKVISAIHISMHSSHPALSQYSHELSHSVSENEERQKAALRQTVSDLQEVNASLAAAAERYQEEIKSNSAKHFQEVEGLRAQHNEAIKELTGKFDREKERLGQEKNELLKKQQERFEREKEVLQQNIDKLHSELIKIRAKAEQGMKEVNPQVAELNAKKQELEKEITRQRTEMAAKTQQHAAEKEKLQKDIKSLHEKEMAALEARYQRECAEQTSLRKAEKQKFEATIEELTEQLNAAAKKVKTLEDQCMTEKAVSTDLKRRLTETLEEMRKTALVKVEHQEKAAVVKSEPQEKVIAERSELPEPTTPKIRLPYLSKSQKLKELGKYEECCAELEKGWGTVQMAGIRDKRTLAIGVALVEVLAIHQGRFGEAEAIANHALQIATENSISSKEVHELRNCKAALYCHSGNFTECISACKSVFASFTKHSADLLWTALYYKVLASSQAHGLGREDRELFQELARLRQIADVSLCQVLKLCVNGRLLLCASELQQAEEQLREAEGIAAAKFPTSIYYAMILYFQGELYRTLKRTDEAKEKYANAEKLFSGHFPASVFRAINLTWISDACKDLKKELDMAIKHRRKVDEILKAFHPALINRPLNLHKLAELFQASGQKDRAVEMCLEADALLKEHFRWNACYLQNLTLLAELCEELKRPEEALTKRLEADQAYREQDPTNLAYPVNLARLAELYFNLGQRQKAVEKRLEASKIFRTHHLADINTALNLSSLGVYRSKMGQVDAEQYFSEAEALFAVNHPLTNDEALNLYYLGLLKERANRAEAIALLQRAFDIWTNNRSEKALALAQPKLRELRGLK